MTDRSLETTTTIRFDATAADRPVSGTLFGLFFEDINFACDGGLNANLVNNYSFDAVYGEERGIEAVMDRRASARVFDRTRHWEIDGGSLTSCSEDPVAPESWFGRVASDGGAVLVNPGYPGDEPGIVVRTGEDLRFTALFRVGSFDGDLEVQLSDVSGEVIARHRLTPSGLGWQRLSATLEPTADATVALQLVFDGSGTVDVDEVSLVPVDHWGAGDPRWTQGKLRRDLVESLRDLAPTFMRFPGGCIVEGHGNGNAYDWKKTVGPLEGRGSDYNLWASFRPDGDYTQTFQVGFYEYFLLCEDLGMEPMPILNAGLACQFRVDEVVDLDSDDFTRLVDSTIDLIDWATVDPATNEWAKLRADAGHPEPFALNYLGIGNENYGPAYLERFDRITAAVDAHHPGITVVLSAGAGSEGADFDRAWEHARNMTPDVVVDEHFYQSPGWVIAQAGRYDHYPRGGPKVFLGEYAAHVPSLPGMGDDPAVPNSFESALAEAAFLTGIERNAEVVALTCYAPLFHRLDAEQWRHNLIDFTPTTVVKTANYFVQQLFAATVGDRIVPTDGSPPSGVFASSTTTDTTQSIKLVNTTHTAVALVLEVPAARGDVAAVTVIHGEMDATNSITETGEVDYQVAPTTTSAPIEQHAIDLLLPGQSIYAIDVPIDLRRA